MTSLVTERCAEDEHGQVVVTLWPADAGILRIVVNTVRNGLTEGVTMTLAHAEALMHLLADALTIEKIRR